MAAVVLPTESSLSVISRTWGSRPAISAIPPELSAMGPYASTATVMPVVESMPTAARAMPYRPEVLYATRMPMQIRMMGTQVLIMPVAMPLMMVVAAPVSDCSAIFLTNL